MQVYLYKLNGWPTAYDERVVALSKSVDSIVLFRSAPEETTDTLDALENVKTVDVVPTRGDFVEPGWLKPIVFSLHVVQAVLFSFLLILKEKKRPDAIHAIDYILGGTAAAIVSTVSAVPFVTSVRGMKEPMYQQQARNGGLKDDVKYQILTTLSGQILPKADHIVTKAEYQRQFVQETHDVNAGFSTVPTGVDFDEFDPNRDLETDVLASLFPDRDISFSDRTVFLFLGKFLPYKGLDILLELIRESESELPEDALFVCIGEVGDANFEAKVERLHAAVADRVLLRPTPVSFSKVPALFDSVDAITLLSRPNCEGVPRVLQEAYVMETPVIASDVTGISNAFDDLPGCYLIDVNSSGEFAAAVQNVVDHPAKPDREKAAQRFHIENNYSRYADIYRGLSEAQ